MRNDIINFIMIVEIANKTFQIVITDKAQINIDWNQNPPAIYSPAHIRKDELEEYIKNQSEAITTEESYHYHDQPIVLFQENYLLKIVENQTQSKVVLKNRTITISTKKTANWTKILDNWKKVFIEQIVIKRISYWEEELNLLINKIHFRTLKNKFYTINKEKIDITFSSNIYLLSEVQLQYLTFKTIQELFHSKKLNTELYFSNEDQLQEELQYILKKCQQ